MILGTVAVVESVVEPLLVERGGFVSYLFGFGVAFFAAIALGATASAKAICTTAIINALFGGIVVGGRPCITAAAIAVTSAAIAGGITSYGASVGWKTESVGAEVGPQRRQVFAPLIDAQFGISHNYDAVTHNLLNSAYGDMLSNHNATILSVTWIETLRTANHTGGALEALDMSQGRILTLSDNGVIRAGVGHSTMMGHLLDSFNDFKIGGPSNPLLVKKDLSVNWVSFNTYGENMNEANGFKGNVKNVLNNVESYSLSSAGVASDTAFAETSSGMYHNKFCLGVSPQGQSVGQESMIVGEVYMNAWGGIDQQCQSA